MKGKDMSIIDWVAGLLVIVGAINWGLVGLFGFDLVATILGDMSVLSRTVYTLVGVSGLWTIYAVSKCCKSS